MATYVGIGYSTKNDWQEAAFEAAVMVRKQLANESVDFLLLLATSEYCRAEILPAIRSVLNPAQLIGSSAAAIILADQIMTKGIALLAIKSDTLSFHCEKIAINTNTNMRTAGFDLSRHLIKEPKAMQRQGCLLIGDGFYRQTHEFFHGTGEVLGSSSPFIAALSSHSADLRKNVQFFNNQILEHHVVGTVMYSNHRLHIESTSAYKPLGKPRFATKSFEHLLRTLDNKPAVSIYEEFLKVKADDLRVDPLKPHQLYPLGFFDENSGKYLIRNPVDILADGSIVFYGDIPEGSEVHLMITSKEACHQSAEDIAEAMKTVVEDKNPEILFIIESAARYRTLDRFAHQEIMNIREILGFTIPIFGFYTFGEVAPWKSASGGKQIGLNNGGLVLTAIS